MLDPEKTLDIIIKIAVLLFAVSFHESAHGWVAMKCGDNTARDLGRITMNPIRHIDPIGSLLFPLIMAISGGPIFGWAKPVPVSLRNVRNPRQANLLVSAAGPLSNLLLAIVATLLVASAQRAGVQKGGGVLEILVAALVVNVALAVFNLLPVPPLDGFGVLESLLPASMIHVTIWLRRFGFLILVVLMFTGVLNVVMQPAMHFVLGLLARVIRLIG